MVEEFEEAVKYLSSTFGNAVFTAVIGSDGLPVTVNMQHEMDKAKESAEIALIFNDISKVSKALNMGNFIDLFFSTDKFETVISNVNRDYFIVMIMEKPANIGRARLEMNYVISKLRSKIS